jgi:hypothetical protein
MVDPVCSPLAQVTAGEEDDGRSPDQLLELLECLADLRVEIAKQRLAISEAHDDGDPRVREVVDRLADLEASIGSFSSKAAAVHQLAQHIRLL